MLEAAMLRLGGFADLPAAETASLLYWRLTGDRHRGEELSVPRKPEDLDPLIDSALDRLRRRVEVFDDPNTAYRSHPHPDYVPRYSIMLIWRAFRSGVLRVRRAGNERSGKAERAGHRLG